MSTGRTKKAGGAGRKPRVKLISYHTQWKQRNTKLDQELLAQVVNYTVEGCPLSVICGLVGISDNTYHAWHSAGKKYLETGEPGDHYEIYGQFYEEVERAKALWQLNVMRRSLTGEKYAPNWVRDLTLLERRDRGTWGKDAYGDRQSTYNPDERFL